MFDFIYVDSNRISLYLSQFSQFGNLTDLVRSVEEKDESVMGASIKFAHGRSTEGQRTSVEKRYDTQWVAPLTFLEELQARNMIKRELTSAAIGDIILMPGGLSLLDMKMFERAWPVVAENSAAADVPRNRQERRRTERANAPIQTEKSPPDMFGLKATRRIRPTTIHEFLE